MKIIIILALSHIIYWLLDNTIFYSIREAIKENKMKYHWKPQPYQIPFITGFSNLSEPKPWTKVTLPHSKIQPFCYSRFLPEATCIYCGFPGVVELSRTPNFHGLTAAYCSKHGNERINLASSFNQTIQIKGALKMMEGQ